MPNREMNKHLGQYDFSPPVRKVKHYFSKGVPLLFGQKYLEAKLKG
jgi:hypothetical protein